MDPTPSTLKWTSSRVASQTQNQEQASTSSQGSQASRWATRPPMSTSTSAASAPSPSSSSLMANSTRGGSGSSSGGWRSTSSSSASSSSKPASLSGSRWAQSQSQQRPSPSAPPTISVASGSGSTDKKASASHMRNHNGLNGLKPRDATRPIGGKQIDRMALLASPSRGLDSVQTLSTALSSQGSMDLTSPDVQQEFREYISTQIQTRVLPLLPPALPNSNYYLSVLDPTTYLAPSSDNVERMNENGKVRDELSQILLQVRKLREAIVAAKRIDRFAVDVYLLSVYLAILCMDVPQLASTLPRLVLELYPSVAKTDTQEDFLESQTRKDVAAILQVEQETRREEGREAVRTRERMIQLYLLQILCLAGKAKRLGQYASSTTTVTSTTNDAAVPSLAGVLKEYVTQRAIILETYEAEDRLEEVLSMPDKVYTAIRDTNPFILGEVFARRRTSKASTEEMEGGRGGLNVWQSTLLYQLIPVMRTKVWKVAQRAYLYLPVSESLAQTLDPGLVTGFDDHGQGSTTSCHYLAQLLLLSCSILPPTTQELAEAEAGAGRRSESGASKRTQSSQEPPDEWDAEPPTSSNITDDIAQSLERTKLADLSRFQLERQDRPDTVQTKIEERRVKDFLINQFGQINDKNSSSTGGDGDGVSQRVVKIKEGCAIKIRS